MSRIDNDESLFQFDPYEGLNTTISAATCLHPQGRSAEDRPDMSHNIQEAVGQVVELMEDNIGKGKGVSKPMPIPSNLPIENDPHDLFDMSPSGSTLVSSYHVHRSLSSPLTPSSLDFHLDTLDLTWESSKLEDLELPNLSGLTIADNGAGSSFEKGKGKERDPPPSLPPLTFSPTEFGYNSMHWPLSAGLPSTPGPSSFGSASASPPTGHPTSSPASLDQHETPLEPPNNTPILRRIPSRRRSFSNVSVRSTHSLAARSMSRIKVKLGQSNNIPSNLARKLLFKRHSSSPPPALPINEHIDAHILDYDLASAEKSSYFIPWHADVQLKHQALTSSSSGGVLEFQPLSNHLISLRSKGRSNSSPLPFSALDLVTTTSNDIFTPIPLVVHNYFDDVLPKELRLQVLLSLVAIHEQDHLRRKSAGLWTVGKATGSKNKWVGRSKGVRELVKLSRVSKSWQMLVFDGQIWESLDLRDFPIMPTALLLRLTQFCGPFVTSLDVAGHVHLNSAAFFDVTDSLCMATAPMVAFPYTQLTAVNLRGCTAISTRSLHQLLVRSPSLKHLCIKGLSVVTNTTCDVIAMYCQQLVSLDVSRCSNMDAEGIRYLASATKTRREYLSLKELRIAGLAYVDDHMMATLGRAAPYLEVLDLSYSRQLHNSALEAFVACNENEEDVGVDTVLLNAREAGRDSNDRNKYRRRVTRLRHLSLSYCILLTDTACSNLAYSVPQLEFLEMAGIGDDLKDEGLIRLLNTTPLIKRLDLEDASDITDSVIAAITPSTISDARGVEAQPSTDSASASHHGEAAAAQGVNVTEPGHALEHLVVSYASNITEQAFLSLIRACTKLRVLEAENTRMGTVVLREFVRLSRKREMLNAKISAIDCRGIGETLVRELSSSTRPRMGWRAYDARKLKYLDGRDGDLEDLKVGQDECDEKRVVLKSFYSWQTVDAVKAAREKRRKSISRRATNDSTGSNDSDDFRPGGRMGAARWWSPTGRRSGRNTPPAIGEMPNDACRIM